MTYLAMWGGVMWALASIAVVLGAPVAGLLAPWKVKPRWLGILALPAGFAASAGAAVSLGYAAPFAKGLH